MEKLAVNFGCEILKIIPGRVSTEVDASFRLTPREPHQGPRLHRALPQGRHRKERILIKSARPGKGSAPPSNSKEKASTAT